MINQIQLRSTLMQHGYSMNRLCLEAVIFFCILALFPASASAESSKKLPEGSRDNEIKLFAFCLGQASARVPKLTDSLNEGKEYSTGYLAIKTVSVYKHMQFMYKATLATVNSVENPSSEILSQSKAMGEKKGAEMFEVENKCLGMCSTTGENNDPQSCIDGCTKQQNPDLDSMIRLCETVYTKFQTNSGSSKN